MPSTTKTKTIPGNPLASMLRESMAEFIDPSEGWQTTAALASELGVSPKSLAPQLERMIQAGKVERRMARLQGRAGAACYWYRPTP